MPPTSDLNDFFLHRAGQWIAMAEMQRAFPKVPVRTLRNWVAALAREGTVERTGANRGARYRWAASPPSRSGQVRTASSSLAAGRASPFSHTAMQILARVTQPLYLRPPVTYAEAWVRSYKPNVSFYLSAAQRAQLQGCGKRPAIHGRAGTYIQKIYNRLLIDLSYNSSRLEGNTYSLADTEALVMRGVGAEGKLKEEQVMILNHKEAIRYLAQNAAQLALQEETIRTLHYLLADGLVAPELAGQIRSDGVLVSGTTYAPLEGRDRLARHLQSLLKTASRIEDPFEQSFFLLAHLSYLQAFIDVNKRVARLASVIPLIRDDFVPQSFVDADKNDYMNALICVYEFNEVRPLAELYTWSYLRTCEHYNVSVQVLGFDELAVLYRAQRRALVGEIVRTLTPLSRVPAFLKKHMPRDIATEHREKFGQDLLTDLKQLNVTRLPGLGVDKRQLQAWLDLSSSRNVSKSGS